MKKKSEIFLAMYGLLTFVFILVNLLNPQSANEKNCLWPQITIKSSTGLVELDTASLKQSINRLPSTKYLRQIGNSIRLQFGQKLSWCIWGEVGPLMLFLKNELWVSEGLKNSENCETVAKALDNISRIKTFLKMKGWELVIVPVPTKLSIYNNRVQWPINEKNPISNEPVNIDNANEIYQKIIKDCENQQIHAVDLDSAFRKYLASNPEGLIFPRGESHWSGLGLRLAAESTADLLAIKFHLKKKNFKPSFFDVLEIADLAKGFDPLPQWLGPLKDVYRYKDKLVNGDVVKGYTYPTSPIAYVVVVGTSYSGHFTWHVGQPVGFPWVLALNLENVNVENAAEAGHGSTSALRKYLQKIQNKTNILNKEKNNKKILIWEFPVRDIKDISLIQNLNCEILKNNYNKK